MPIYRMMCEACGQEEDIFRTVATRDQNLPHCCGATMVRRMCAPFVRGDLAEYQAMAPDRETGHMPVIQGRAQHREFLRRNGYVEVGDAKLPDKPREIRGDFDVKPQLIEATKHVLAKQTARH